MEIDRTSATWKLCARRMKNASDEEIDDTAENFRLTLELLQQIARRQIDEEQRHKEEICPTCGRKYGAMVVAFQRTPNPIRDACREVVCLAEAKTKWPHISTYTTEHS